eukprot:CAMPEP_0182541096 /NCGR_PEP_ID=MMETSP1323-20130603/28125_1 /TAXON_ID=236787 /ORGANISM="Florenciella parvula, Strain RCC1693" /LENGTH=56 /DNA_ID=CAMNT_0024751823 /DNA_START=91 /DNA_END=261 /DNA_ORIENTATION=-
MAHGMASYERGAVRRRAVYPLELGLDVTVLHAPHIVLIVDHVDPQGLGVCQRAQRT